MSESPEKPVPVDHQLPAPGETKAARRPIYKRPFIVILFIVLIVLAIVGTIFWLHGRHYQETDDAQIDAHIVPINAQVSARVERVHIDDNMFVHQGDLLVELDPTDYQAALDQVNGKLAAAAGKAQQATADIDSAQSMIDQARAALAVQQVNADNAERDLKRYQGLDDRAKSQQSQDNALAAEKTAVAEVAAARAALEVNQSKLASSKASAVAAAGDLVRAQADVKAAQVTLGYCRIVAPMDGFVTTKNVDPGQYATPSTPLFSLVSPSVWVIANFKETQLTDMKVGQEANITIDAYPDLAVRGKVQSVMSGTGSRFSVIPAENATGNYVKVVQRVPVKVTLDSGLDPNAAQKLSPGMSVDVSVHTMPGDF